MYALKGAFEKPEDMSGLTSNTRICWHSSRRAQQTFGRGRQCTANASSATPGATPIKVEQRRRKSAYSGSITPLPLPFTNDCTSPSYISLIFPFPLLHSLHYALIHRYIHRLPRCHLCARCTIEFHPSFLWEARCRLWVGLPGTRQQRRLHTYRCEVCADSAIDHRQSHLDCE